jgi:8-amino-7-oxononanoate synthase
MEAFLTDTLNQIRQKGLYRAFQFLESAPGPVVMINGKRVIQFSSNNYLGLANHPVLKKAAKEAVEKYGVGVGASRLITGNIELYGKLEERMAKFKHTESALIFPTGYQANVGTITALLGPDDVIFSDALNHASIVDGCRLSGAQIMVYPHRDLDSLEKIIRKAPKARNRMIITDGIFSMDGTIAPLSELASLARNYGCWLMVDEAHATGVLGKGGRGTAEFFGVEGEVDIQMGTFSKALGSLGGYIAGSRKLIEFLTNKCRSLIYTTGLPPAVLAVNQAAIDLVEKGSELREKIREKAKFFREELNKLGYNTLNSETQIIPVLIGDNGLTMEFSKYLFRNGIFAQGIRPPTVPEGLSRVRISIMATHEWEDLQYGIEIFKKAGKKFGII